MGILELLKKHYLATILFIVGLGLTMYAGADLYQQKNTELAPPTSEDQAIILEPANQIALVKNTNTTISNGEIQNTEKKENKITTSPPEPSTSTPNTTTTPKPEPEQSTGTPVDLTQGTFIISGSSYPVQFIAGSTVYDVMKNLNDNGKVSIKFKNYSGLGHFVDGINGVNSDTFRAKYWIYYINGAKAQIGISQYTLKSNDIITWKYESAE